MIYRITRRLQPSYLQLSPSLNALLLCLCPTWHAILIWLGIHSFKIVNIAPFKHLSPLETCGSSQAPHIAQSALVHDKYVLLQASARLSTSPQVAQG